MEETSTTIMLNLRKTYVLDENQEPIAVQISIEDFQRLEAMIEEYGLMDVEDDRQGVSQEEVAGLSETEFLLRSPANVVHLERSIGQLRQGKVTERGLVD
jgi:PHD/YefM family antitoxin component YafN of YafNO toxin-antitoxin module